MSLSIQDLPPEILQRIFEASIEDTETIVNGCSEDIPELGRTFTDFERMFIAEPYANFPHDLLQVCRHWRNVAFATPALWTTISLATEMKQSMKSIASYFERSGELLLDVWLKIDSHYEKTLHEGILHVLRNHLHRVRNLALVLDNENMEYPEALSTLFPAGRHFDMYRLERFYCALGVTHPDEPPKIPPLATLRAPKIKSFIVNSDVGYLIRSVLASSVENVTRMGISFNYPATEQDLRPISQCHELRSLDWCRYGCPLPNSLPFDFNFHHLQSLSLLLITEEACSAVSLHFHTPKLEQFHMRGDYSGNIVWIGPFLKRNSQLKRLMIHVVEAHDDMTDVFTQLSQLTTLNIFKCSISDPFIATLLAEVNGQLILPNLRFLEVFPVYDQPIPSKLVEVARSRLTDDEETCANVMFVDFDALPADLEELDRLAEKYDQKLCLVDMQLYGATTVVPLADGFLEDDDEVGAEIFEDEVEDEEQEDEGEFED